MTACAHCDDHCMGMDPDTGEETLCPACGRTPRHWEATVYTPPEDSAEDQAAKQQIAGEAERKRRWTAMALWGRLLDDWEDEGHVPDERYEAVRADVEAALGRTLLSITDRDEFCRLMAALGEV